MNEEKGRRKIREMKNEKRKIENTRLEQNLANTFHLVNGD
jgi:hypothetical protein